MLGRKFLKLAREGVVGPEEYHWRGAAVHAYYGIFLECRDALFRRGFHLPRRDNVPSWVRLKFAYAADADLRLIGDTLDHLVRLRNQASYDMAASVAFASPQKAHFAVQDATNALAIFDACEADPGRHAAAIASIEP